MSERIFYETVDLSGSPVPVRIFCRHTNSSSKGCYFNWHLQMEFFYVEKGGILLQCGRNSQWIFQGDIGVVNCNEPHRSLRFLDDTVHHLIQVDLGELFAGMDRVIFAREVLPLINGEAGIQNYIVQSQPLCEWFRRLVRGEEEKKTGYELSVIGCLHMIFSLLLGGFRISFGRGCAGISSPNNRMYVGEILSYVERHYQSAIRLADIANQLHITVPHLCRIFKAETGSSIIQYCNLIRCHRAKLLLESGCSVTETAGLMGFSDSNYFSRVFKREMGLAPSAVMHA